MKTASIRTMQHQLAAMVAEVEKGAEIVITRHNRPVARLSPVSAPVPVAATTPASIRRYWRQRSLPPAVNSQTTHADLVADGRGEV
jgi:prevent-host-death family protein